MSLLATICLLGSGVAVPHDPPTVRPAEDGITADLSFRAQRKWRLQLPAERWQPVGTSFALAKTHGFDFKTELVGTRLKVDTDGDGTTDVTLAGKTAYVTLRGKTPSGEPTSYGVRLKNDGGWKFAPGGFLTGKINGTTVKLIDQNNNGVFGEAGQDAMILGTRKVATWASEAIHLDGKLYSARVSADGSELICTPFEGPVGKLHLSCTTKGKVLSAIVRSTDKRYSFDMARARDGMTVPVNAYKLMIGQLGLGKDRVTMETGKSKPIPVPKDATKQVCWGGPVRAEFEYQQAGGKVHLSPEKVWLYGAAGELYTGWVPLGASPKFKIVNDTTGIEVATAEFPGSC